MRVLFLYALLAVTTTVCSAISISTFDHYAKAILYCDEFSTDTIKRHLHNVDEFRFCDVVPDNSTTTGYACRPTNYIEVRINLHHNILRFKIGNSKLVILSQMFRP